jgi:hypothetical protein
MRDVGLPIKYSVSTLNLNFQPYGDDGVSAGDAISAATMGLSHISLSGRQQLYAAGTSLTARWLTGQAKGPLGAAAERDVDCFLDLTELAAASPQFWAGPGLSRICGEWHCPDCDLRVSKVLSGLFRRSRLSRGTILQCDRQKASDSERISV